MGISLCRKNSPEKGQRKKRAADRDHQPRSEGRCWFMFANVNGCSLVNLCVYFSSVRILGTMDRVIIDFYGLMFSSGTCIIKRNGEDYSR